MSRVNLSVEQRQGKITLASWLSIICGLGMLAGAFVLIWLNRSN